MLAGGTLSASGGGKGGVEGGQMLEDPADEELVDGCWAGEGRLGREGFEDKEVVVWSLEQRAEQVARRTSACLSSQGPPEEA